MISSNGDEKNISWAIKIFRPLLKDLDIQNHMANFYVVLKTIKFENEDDRGLFVWQYDDETKSYALYICINRSMFENNTLDFRIQRKTTGIHEFTHCVASMIICSHLESKELIRTLNQRMQKTFHHLSRIELEKLLHEYTMSINEKETLKAQTFPDEHFRIIGDGFDDDYSKLAKNFLLSYELFCEDKYCNQDKRKKLKKLLNTGDSEAAARLLLDEVINPLSEDKALSKRFIIQRIEEEFGNSIMNE